MPCRKMAMVWGAQTSMIRSGPARAVASRRSRNPSDIAVNDMPGHLPHQVQVGFGLGRLKGMKANQPPRRETTGDRFGRRRLQ